MEFLREAVISFHFIERELVLFATFWFLLGALDDISIDGVWIWLKLTGRAREERIDPAEAQAPLRGKAAVFIAAWQEARVIGYTIRHAMCVWSHADLVLYIGCYANDPETIAAAMVEGARDPRVRIVIHNSFGPTTKADCLNRLYRALCEDEHRNVSQVRSIILHDSEDMVHPAELAIIDRALDYADFVQLPVRPEPNRQSRWVSGHYMDEFAEAHGKALVVRDALGGEIPAAGVGCGFSRGIIERISSQRMKQGGEGPFSAECLTEDYELGILVHRLGGQGRFLRVRDDKGRLVAARAYFPASLQSAVRQKSRWIHGIAFQGWERLGWEAGLRDRWMAMRDRRGPLTAIVLTAGYALVVVEGLCMALSAITGVSAPDRTPVQQNLLFICSLAFAWRVSFRVFFTASEYGILEGFLAIIRIPVANTVAILAGRRALSAYISYLQGKGVFWDKTGHDRHPAADDLNGNMGLAQASMS